MSSEDPTSSDLIPGPLREALRLTPTNVPLLVHVADTLLRSGEFAGAETLFKRALSLQADNLNARLGLAAAFFQQGKHSAALVIVEALTHPANAPARALLLHSRLALRGKEPQLAAELYQRALVADPTCADVELASALTGYLPKPSPIPRAQPKQEEEEIVPADEPEPDNRVRLPVGEIPGSPGFEVERPTLSFADVGGMDAVKEEIRMKIILPIQQPNLFKAYGKKIGGGILLYGPPGCGKTFLARATAGQVQAAFMPVAINDVLEMYIGQSEKNLHALFEQARSNRPCVLFFDEVDALGGNRTDLAKTGGRSLINQFLNELDGVQTSNEGVLILAATNAPWHLDPAFRRPGRFDRILFVPPPDAEARASILRLQLKGKPVEAIDFDAVSKKTEGFSGADLKAVVDLAIESRLREAMRTGRVQPVTERDLSAAAKQHRPSTRDWFESARNHALYANQSGLYDDVLAHLKIKK